MEGFESKKGNVIANEVKQSHFCKDCFGCSSLAMTAMFSKIGMIFVLL